MKDKKPNDFDFELHMELLEKADKKKLEDTLDFYKENLPLNAVEKLMNESKLENAEVKDKSVSKSSYSHFISEYNESDSEKSVSQNTAKSKKHARSNAESEFLNDIHDKHDVFDYDYTRPKSHIGKIFIAFLFIIFVCIIAVLAFKINSLNGQIEKNKLQVSENDKIRKELQETLLENENMKKMIEDLSNNKTKVTTENEQSQNTYKTEDEPKAATTNLSSETEYVVQKGDTLSSISQKFYGSMNSYDKIVERNKLSGENLSENQKLIIPQK